MSTSRTLLDKGLEKSRSVPPLQERLQEALLDDGACSQRCLALVLVAVLACLVLAALTGAYLSSRGRPVYLLDFNVYKPPEKYVCSISTSSFSFLDLAEAAVLPRAATYHPFMLSSFMGLQFCGKYPKKIITDKLVCRLKCSHEFFKEQTRAQGCYEAGTLEFMDKILHNSGVGGESYMPPGSQPSLILKLTQNIHSRTIEVWTAAE